MCTAFQKLHTVNKWLVNERNNFTSRAYLRRIFIADLEFSHIHNLITDERSLIFT